MKKRVRVPDLVRMKQQGEPIVALTAYDYTLARLVDAADVDLVLVGDSLGMVVQGHETTLPVTLDEMIYHTRAVARGCQRALVVLDMPFGSTQNGPERTFEQAARAMKESGAAAIKLEGGQAMAATVAYLTERAIPVIGHLGLTPQSVHAFGGFKIQGRDQAAAQRIADDALALQQAGAGAIILEGIPAALAQQVSQSLTIPTIGIGAGVGCDGQVLVIYDMLGLYGDLAPKFVKRYLDGVPVIGGAIGAYVQEVRNRQFPTPDHSFEK
ncbi:ketopantoate hydroxymethyltransferase [Magnetococcus marinus MC-1]|uniref:3-methyl-2-oxobutanoate hydroxymethyltransferase n=1 Tax=Magnetococcus marinus (strain ATCC BAA-1437 / JCM 17883 / MC-1) TaxID=156889 RepID=PANB_MAGMM|nr:3-methyl-2-oxobutanoate hydroxymethyltransferase [Magnetococcus marinus]A0L3M6.1 RecName: Full=3-methyl-2-oxobutanoate hydroxymethyltransferase; AltName: Full=Ketopantoate hydroxymethyltransferase; Short=KPHMT [Magnetococcus marinus MC-1]ABK42569.1 ketopantoate hydroxymethyltransferase [Magnetococcus marinus MC-1]